jgi:tetrahydromethanopterin S-methyltransferase subunit H
LLSPKDVLIRALVGTSSPEKCDSKTTYLYRLENDLLVGEFRGNGNLISTTTIRLDAVKYIGSFNGMHRVAYRSISEAANNNKIQNINDVTIETDFKIRRTLESTRGTVQLIKDGVVVSSNQKTLDIVKCN